MSMFAPLATSPARPFFSRAHRSRSPFLLTSVVLSAARRFVFARRSRPFAIHNLRAELVDIVFVGLAGAILVGAGLLQKSLGDVIGDEAGLPAASGAKSKREAQRSKRLLNKGPAPKKDK